MNRTITLTPRELEMIMTALDTHTTALERDLGQSRNAEWCDQINEFNELRDDLLAESAGHHDDWPSHIHVNDADDRFNEIPPDAAGQFIDAGIIAREMKKAMAQPFADSDVRLGSLGAQRRLARHQIERMMRGTATPPIEED